MKLRMENHNINNNYIINNNYYFNNQEAPSDELVVRETNVRVHHEVQINWGSLLIPSIEDTFRTLQTRKSSGRSAGFVNVENQLNHMKSETALLVLYVFLQYILLIVRDVFFAFPIFKVYKIYWEW